MNKQRRQAGPSSRPLPKNSGYTILATGAVCLLLGTAAGYYLGSQRDVQPAHTATQPTAAQANSSVMNPAAFLEMESSLKSAAARNPRDLNTLIRLGNLYYDSGRFREAVDWYGRALEMDPNNVNVRTDRGTSYWNIGQADEAIAEFSRSLQVNPTHGQTLYNLGVVYLHGKENAAEARKVWEKLLETNPNYPDREQLRRQIAELAKSEPAPGSAGGVEDLLRRMNTR